MYIVGLDQSWLQSPFLFHRRQIGRYEEIARLKAYGIRQVTIDLNTWPGSCRDLPQLPEVKGEGVPQPGESPSFSTLSERAQDNIRPHHLWSTT